MGAEAYPELAVKAAAFLESVARFHPLIDGNKRTAWTLMVLLLWINGYRHGFTTDEGFDLVVGVAAGTIDLLASAAEISRHLVPWYSSSAPEGVWTMSTLFVSYWAKQPSDWPGFRMFRGFPVISRPRRQFESHLGHSISPRQRGFCFNVLT
jgi:Fic/DOC family